jgi:putative transposase
MVRAGVVKHPEEWAWCGYREFMGLRERYRILDVGTLLTMLGYADLKKARVYYRSELEKQLTRGGLERDPIWTESLAVGDRSFIDAVKKSVSRLRIYMTERTTPEATKVWSIREARSAYS